MPQPESSFDRHFAGRALFHLACVFALAWPAIVNRQPFFFPDTTSYVRAGDIILHKASGGRITTPWSAHYQAGPAGSTPGEDSAKAPVQVARGNDVASGNIMAGRSPYFGALLFAGYLTSDFWLFVLFQAAVTYALIRLSFGCFGATGPRRVGIAVGFVSLLTTAPFFDSYLMPDALAGQALLALAILVARRDSLDRRELAFLFGVLALSVASHLTHLVFVLVAMAALFVHERLAGEPPASRRMLLRFTLALALVGGGASALTDFVISRVFGKTPLLVPLLTSRFIEDGPGTRYVREHCQDRRFAVCDFADRLPTTAVDFLWSHDPARGVFMPADPDTRRRLCEEDKAFALEVLKHYPVDQIWSALRNTAIQASLFDSFWLNYGGTPEPGWWSSLPEAERERMRRSRSGTNSWPAGLLTGLHYAVIVLSVGFLLVHLGRSGAGAVLAGVSGAGLRAWLVVLTVGLLTNAALGGAISVPQSRYQARVVWVVALTGLLVGMGKRGERRSQR